MAWWRSYRGALIAGCQKFGFRSILGIAACQTMDSDGCGVQPKPSLRESVKIVPAQATRVQNGKRIRKCLRGGGGGGCLHERNDERKWEQQESERAAVVGSIGRLDLVPHGISKPGRHGVAFQFQIAAFRNLRHPEMLSALTGIVEQVSAVRMAHRV